MKMVCINGFEYSPLIITKARKDSVGSRVSESTVIRVAIAELKTDFNKREELSWEWCAK